MDFRPESGIRQHQRQLPLLNHTRPTPPQHIVLGTIRKDRQVLLLWRETGYGQGGCWSFPGGKVEPGEYAGQALVRELREETGLETRTTHPLINVTCSSHGRDLFLEVFEAEVTEDAGFYGGDFLQWRPIGELRETDFLPANRPMLNALRLPDYYALVSLDEKRNEHEKALEQAFACEDSFLTLRAPHLSTKVYAGIVRRIFFRFKAQRKRILLHDHPELVPELGAAGVHLSQGALRQDGKRPVARDCWFAASCHSLAEIREAQQRNVDFCVLGPVRSTRSHPGQQGIGFESFAAIVRHAEVPVYAIGGLGFADYETARRHRARGIAGISCFLGKG